VNVSCEPGIGTAVIDQNQIALAIAELIVNGVQANPRRGVDVRAGVDGFDGRLVITVTDDGAGMSPTALEHAFDPFFSELAAGRRPGLGLTRARRYVDLHGGEVTLESTPGKGTTARIILPEWRDSQSRRPIPIANQAA
jgi:signal transduction histidine kinase